MIKNKGLPASSGLKKRVKRCSNKNIQKENVQKDKPYIFKITPRKRRKKEEHLSEKTNSTLDSVLTVVILAGVFAAACFLLGGDGFTGLIVWSVDSQSDFDEGTYMMTYWSTTDNLVQLNSTSTTGSYISKIFDAPGISQWKNISWVSNAIGELPDNGAVETKYGDGNADMTENVLLLHMNEASGTIIDSSGKGNNGTYYGALYGQTGKLNAAIGFDGVADYINCGNDTSLSFANTITSSAWVKPDSGTYGYILAKNHYTKYGVFVTESDSQFRTYIAGSSYSSDYSFPTDSWTHVVSIYDFLNSNLMHFINGVNVQNFTVNADTDSNGLPVVIGKRCNNVTDCSGGAYFFDGLIDEVALFKRVLSAQEIVNIYKRGLLRLNISVRSCNDINCSGEGWSDINDNSPQDLNISDNKYFQYKFEFETDNVTYSPKLYNVTINYEYDSIPPDITVIKPVNCSSHHSNWVEADVTLNEAGGCNYSVDGSAYSGMDPINSTHFYKNMTNLTEGLHNVTFNCTDLQGNCNTTLREFTISFNPNCSNGLKDQDESDVDCGGICGSNCKDTQVCNVDPDCLNNVCESGICVSCFDEARNNDETDIDCGGPNCVGCSSGRNCTGVSDCDDATSCSDGICCSCSDEVKNQGEDLVDCGGSYCSACPFLRYFYDDCGNPANETHLIQGVDFTFVGGINSSLSDAEKSVNYHNEKVIYRFPVDYTYDYKVNVKLVQPTGGGRIQKLLADSYVLDASRSVPEYNPEEYSYNIPTSSYNGDSSFDLIFERLSGSNAVCSEIEVWKSTSPSDSLSESSKIFDFNIPEDYSYDSSEIVVEDSSAHLINRLVCRENNSYYDFNPVASDLSYGSYNLKTIFNLSKTYDYYEYSIELKRDGAAEGMFQIAVNNAMNVINVTNASTISSENYQTYTVNMTPSWILNRTPEIWTLTKSNVLFKMDGTPSNNSYYRSVNDGANNTGWNLDNNDYYHMIKGYENITGSSGTIETDDLVVDNLLEWLSVSINDYSENIYSNESDETYDYASNQTGASASAQGGAEHLIDEDETVDGGDYYATCSWPCNMSITFNESVQINKIYTHFWDGDGRHYNYSLWVSADGSNWTRLVENKYSHGPQNDTFNVTLTKYLRVEGVSNTANNGFHVIEVDAFEALKEKEIKYYYSVDSGTGWNSVPLDGDISDASTTNSKIRFKAEITGSGILYDLNVSYYTSTEANCSDEMKNQDETDIDCGGSICSKCSDGNSCLVNSDCQSDLCSDELCKTAETNNGDGDGGGGGGGGGARSTALLPAKETEEVEEQPETVEDYVIKNVSEIFANKAVEVLFNRSLYSIELTTNEDAKNVIFKVKELDKGAELIPALNSTYKYLEIYVKVPSSEIIDKVIIKFKVNKEWLNENDFNKAVLYRYAGDKWNRLNTEKFDEDNNSIYYKADAAGFSYFAIRGEKVEEIQEPEILTPVKRTKDYSLFWIFLIGIPTLLVILLVLKCCKKRALHKKPKKPTRKTTKKSAHKKTKRKPR